MIADKSSLLNVVADVLSLPSDRLSFCPLSVADSMSGAIEEGFDGSIFCLKTDSGKRYVAKRKCLSFIERVGESMNPFASPEFRAIYRKAYGVFYIRESHLREHYIYDGIDPSLRPCLPLYYGSYKSPAECVHVMEYLPILRDKIDLKGAAAFLARLHAVYAGREKAARDLHANIPTPSDYTAARPLSAMLYDNIQRLYPDFPQEILKDMRAFSDDANAMACGLNTWQRTLCQGDFCVKNMTFLPRGIRVYDWELATFNHPAFDLISFLVHYPVPIDDRLIEDWIGSYRNAASTCERLEPLSDKCLAFNVRLYMATRFHAMMNICRSVDMPYMPVSIANWLKLYRTYQHIGTRASVFGVD